MNVNFKAAMKRWRPKYRLAAIAGTIVFLLALISEVPAYSQVTDLPKISLPQVEQRLRSVGSEQVATAQVTLDGYKLFTIAAPEVTKDTNKPDSPDPIQQRLESIEKILNQISESNFNPKQLTVSSTIDQQSGLPVISVNDQYLMTVTTLDAQIQGVPPERLADDLVPIIKNALLRSKQERQPDFLTRQALIAAGIVVLMVLSSGAITIVQEKVRRQRSLLQQEVQRLPEPTGSPEQAANRNAQAVERLQQQQQISLNATKGRLLKLIQIGIWAGGIFVIVGLFPYSRQLQPILFSAPLKVFGLGLAVYFLVRLTDALIDRFFKTFEDTQPLTVVASQRLALRISTASRVVKSATTILWVGGGLLMALAVLGVNLLPLLAGAGIVGLAISFASQNVIKDVINGFLILMEDQYAVGDVITVGDVSGLVENMNLRITQLRNNEGRLITVPNSQIGIVQNLSKDWSRVDLTIEVAFDSDADRVLQVLRELAEQMYHDREWRAKILERPQVLGIDKIDHTGLLIRIWIKTRPLEQWSVAREFRRRLKQVMTQEHLMIGIPQQLSRLDEPLGDVLNPSQGGQEEQNGQDKQSKLISPHHEVEDDPSN